MNVRKSTKRTRKTSAGGIQYQNYDLEITKYHRSDRLLITCISKVDIDM